MANGNNAQEWGTSAIWAKPIDQVRAAQIPGRAGLTEEEHQAALAYAEGREGTQGRLELAGSEAPGFVEPPEGLTIDKAHPWYEPLERPGEVLVGGTARPTDPTLKARQAEQAVRPGVEAEAPAVQAKAKLKEAKEQRQLLGGRMPIGQAEAGTREAEGIAAVGDPMTAPEKRGQTPEERDAEARWKQVAKFFTKATGLTALQGGVWAGATLASPAFGAALGEWRTYKDKLNAGALGRDREEAAKGLVYPRMLADHATAMRNMTMALSGAGAMSAAQVTQIMRVGATSLIDASVKAAQFVAIERAKGIKDDKTLGMEAAQTLNNVMKEGVGLINKFVGDVAVQQGRKDAGEALFQVADSINKLPKEVREKAWVQLRDAENRGDKQAILDIAARYLASIPAGATPAATESAPAQGAAAPATPAAEGGAYRVPDRPAPVPLRDPGEAPDLSSDAVLGQHQQDLFDETEGHWQTISPDMHIEVAEFEALTPADKASLPTHVLATGKGGMKWVASNTTPGWFVLEITNPTTKQIESYVKSPDGRIWGDDQVEDVVAENA